MSNVKTAISVLWVMFTFVIGAYYFVLTNDVQNLEKELAQINQDIQMVSLNITLKLIDIFLHNFSLIIQLYNVK